ncbi:probable peptidoglycan muropeptide transporter SLC46 isoform X2 [Anabrus simplex]
MENQFYLDKVCRANRGYNESLCAVIGDGNHTAVQVEVQRQVANFLIYNNLVRQVLPVIPGFLMAMWTDRHGARTAIIIGMVGKTIYFMGYMLNAHFFTEWPVEFVLVTAALPRALCGYDVGIFMAVQSHLAEATPPEKLTMRLAALETANQIAAPVGFSLGSLIFNGSGRNYTATYCVSSAVSAFGLLYAVLFLRNLERHRNSKNNISCEDIHLLGAMKTTCKPRADHSHRVIFLLLAMIFFQSMMYDSPLLYLYSQLRFQWDTTNFSHFMTLESCAGIVVVALVVPMLKKKPQIPDVCVLTCGVLMTIASRLCYALARHEWIMYIGTIASSFQSIILVSIRSMASKITTVDDRGKVLSMFTSIESGAALLSSPMYSQVYNSTIETFPSTIFFVSILLQCCILILIPILRSSMNTRAPVSSQETQKRDTEDSLKKRVPVSRQETLKRDAEDSMKKRVPVSSQETPKGDAEDAVTKRVPVSSQERPKRDSENLVNRRVPVTSQERPKRDSEDLVNRRGPESSQETPKRDFEDSVNKRVPESTQETPKRDSKDTNNKQ